MHEMKRANVSIEPECDVKPELLVSRFVKVFMEGELVGRKIDMASHRSYASLSFTLKRLGNDFSSKLSLSHMHLYTIPDFG
jgi:auxin-responsive protein IAA